MTTGLTLRFLFVIGIEIHSPIHSFACSFKNPSLSTCYGPNTVRTWEAGQFLVAFSLLSLTTLFCDPQMQRSPINVYQPIFKWDLLIPGISATKGTERSTLSCFIAYPSLCMAGELQNFHRLPSVQVEWNVVQRVGSRSLNSLTRLTQAPHPHTVWKKSSQPKVASALPWARGMLQETEKKTGHNCCTESAYNPDREMLHNAHGENVFYCTPGNLKTKVLCLIYSAISIPPWQWLLITVK